MFRSQIAQLFFNANPPVGCQAISSGTACRKKNRQGVKLSGWGGGIQIAIDKVMERYHEDSQVNVGKAIEMRSSAAKQTR